MGSTASKAAAYTVPPGCIPVPTQRCPLLPFYAGNLRSIPHLYIAGRSPRPARKLAEEGQRRSLMVAVCVRLGRPNVVVQLPTPEEKVKRAKRKRGSVWLNPEGGPVSPLTSKSYCSLVLAELCKRGSKMGAGRRRSPRNPVRVVHDRDSVHTSADTAAFAARQHMAFVSLPPKAPDLDPLEYGVFGAVKRTWRETVYKERMSWEQQCSLLMQLLRDADASVAIQGLPARIQACLDSKGKRFEK